MQGSLDQYGPAKRDVQLTVDALAETYPSESEFEKWSERKQRAERNEDVN